MTGYILPHDDDTTLPVSHLSFDVLLYTALQIACARRDVGHLSNTCIDITQPTPQVGFLLSIPGGTHDLQPLTIGKASVAAVVPRAFERYYDYIYLFN